MNAYADISVENGDYRSWDHIWVLDDLFSVILNHCDDVATTTTKDGFSMEFIRGGMSLCALVHFEDRPRTLFVNVSICRELWYALFGIAHQHDLEFAEFDDSLASEAEMDERGAT
jgi:hypothetical protein